MLRPYHPQPAELYPLRRFLNHPAFATVFIGAVMAFAVAFERGWL